MISVFDNMQDYILQRITVDPGRGCWLWEGQIAKNGYGQFRRLKHESWRKAHRESYLAFHGELSESDCVLHHCDTPACVNPAHLYKGTQKQNVADMVSRGRARNGAVQREFCPRGHELGASNRLGRRADACKTCHRLRQQKYREVQLAL